MFTDRPTESHPVTYAETIAWSDSLIADMSVLRDFLTKEAEREKQGRDAAIRSLSIAITHAETARLWLINAATHVAELER